MKISLELTAGEITILGSPTPRKFHDTGDKLMLAESLIPRLQAALADAQQREYQKASRRELEKDVEEFFATIFTKPS